jgi:N-acetylglucosamine kinase-like BadF-type ATPase
MIIVADSGSTKTDWAIVGKEVSMVQSIGLNPFFFTDEQLEKTIYEALKEVDASSVEGIYFYGSGCGLESNKEKLRVCFRKLFPAAKDVVVDTDLVGAVIALYGNETGIACILGTGANAGIFNGTTITKTPNSLGYMLGDNGSGSVLGLELLKLYLHGFLPASIAADLEDKYDVQYKSILENVYKKDRPNRYFASFSPFVSAHQEEEPIKTMLHDQFSEFFRYFIMPFEKAEGGNLPVRIIGSVGYYYRPVIEKVAAEYGLTIDKIALKPIDLLVEHHSKK